jgi:ketosteroid isomerase-like protein
MSTREGMHALLASVPRSVDRSRIEDVVGRFMRSYPNRDVDTRVSLFAGELRFDDPAGRQFASNKAELRKFFDDTIAAGNTIRFYPERLVVSGDEALQIARVWIQMKETEPVLLLLHLHFVFDSDGLINQLRTFFDADCISAADPDASAGAAQ